MGRMGVAQAAGRAGDMTMKGAAPPVDLVHLRRFTLGDADLERELAALFRDSCTTYVGAMAVAADDRAWSEAAHGLKGAARSIGALHLGDLAEQAEQAGLARRPSMLASLQAEAAAAQSWLEAALGA
jgi:HPt (histidine-containing phosphotransfer) domain-containing protein